MFLLKLLQMLFLLGLSQRAQAPTPAVPQAPDVPSAFRISGRVIDAASGQPIGRVSVSINVSATPDAPASLDSSRVVITDPEGRFVFAGVAPGKYSLSANRRGYFAQMYQQHENFTTAIAVGPGLESENLIFGLRPSASISGEVRDESDDPVRHATVMLFRENLFGGLRRTSSIRQAATDDQGHYHFGYLAPGTYFVSVSAQPWYAQRSTRLRAKQEGQDGVFSSSHSSVEESQPLDVVYESVFFPDSNDLAGAAPLALHAGDMAIADFRLRPVPALHILVRTPVTDPNQGVGIQVSQTLAQGHETQIPVAVNQVSPGLMEVSGVPPGRLNLAWITPNGAGNAATRRTQSIQVSNDAEIDTAQSAPSVVVSGILKMDDASPVPQPARVLLRNLATGQAFTADVSAAREFSFKNNPVQTGNYELIIIEPQALFIRSLSSAGVKTTGHSFQIAGPQDVSITINASRGTGRITGTALKNDKPASAVMIVLAPLDLRSNPALFRRDQSDSDGTFSLNAVVPGRYTLMAIDNGWDLEWANPEVMKKYLAGGESIEITSHQKADFKVNVQ
jgi:5-hydroxyisourate hydrolase-like protein (transthyretin family)